MHIMRLKKTNNFLADLKKMIFSLKYIMQKKRKKKTLNKIT